MTKPQFVMLDRDGVINFDSDNYIKSPEEWRIIPGSANAIAKLNQANIDVFVVSNQSGIGRGYYSLETLQAIHQKMHQTLAQENAHITDIIICPHHPDDNCDCRKPLPGMLHQLADRHSLDLKRGVFVGDSWRDIQAAMSAGCQPILVKTGKGEQTIAAHQHELEPQLIFSDLRQYVDYLLADDSSIYT